MDSEFQVKKFELHSEEVYEVKMWHRDFLGGINLAAMNSNMSKT